MVPKRSEKRWFLARNPRRNVALTPSQTRVHGPVPTGRCNVSKAKNDNKRDKLSPDLDTPTDLSPDAVNKISASLNVLLADAFSLYLKTKNFHRHVSGRHFHDYHLMLDAQS